MKGKGRGGRRGVEERAIDVVGTVWTSEGPGKEIVSMVEMLPGKWGGAVGE